MRRGSFIKKVRLACAPKHPYNTKTHLAQELRSPLNGLEGVPQPRPLPHLHALPTWHIHILQVPFLNAMDFSPCEGDSEEVRPLYYRIPFVIFIRAARHGPSREKKGGKQALRQVKYGDARVLRSEQHTQLGGAQTGKKQALINR